MQSVDDITLIQRILDCDMEIFSILNSDTRLFNKQ
jgi:hypothetical protein